ncbi:MAG: lipase family protein [Acidimicrobiia bacterium]
MTGRVRVRDLIATLMATLALAAGVLTGSGPASAGSTRPAGSAGALAGPDADPFYRPPAGFESAAPGTVFASRAVTVKGLGLPVPVAAHQFLVRSSDAHDAPVAVAGTVMVPSGPYPGTRPLVSYQPAIDSLGDQCNPSYTLRAGTEKELGLMMQALMLGWAVVVTDYQGPDDAFAAGRMAGHAVLDGIRAAVSLPEAGLAGTATPVGMWGYSGGGLATSWAAELQPAYAPELNVVGVASGGTPADLIAAARQVDGGLASGLVLLASAGISRAYPEMLALLDEDGRAMLDRIGDMCVGEAVASFPFRRLNEFTHSADPLSEPVAVEVMERNHLGRQAPGAPVFLFHSLFDELIPHGVARQLSSDWCAQGVTVSFYTDVLSEHSSLAVTGAPLAVSYLGSRFAGLPAPNTCL